MVPIYQKYVVLFIQYIEKNQLRKYYTVFFLKVF